MNRPAVVPVVVSSSFVCFCWASASASARSPDLCRFMHVIFRLSGFGAKWHHSTSAFGGLVHRVGNVVIFRARTLLVYFQVTLPPDADLLDCALEVLTESCHLKYKRINGAPTCRKCLQTISRLDLRVCEYIVVAHYSPKSARARRER